MSPTQSVANMLLWTPHRAAAARAPSRPLFLMWVMVGVVAMGTVCDARGVDQKQQQQQQRDTPFELSVIHLNDFHARYEEVRPDGGACPLDDTSACVGGIARVVAAYKMLQEQKPNALVLNAGDNFQGTLWFSQFGWNVTAHFLNMIPWDAITLGNHEFDRKLSSAVAFIEALDAPVVVANIDDSQEPSFQGIYKKSIIKVIDGRKVGIIGVITDTTKDISSPEKLEFRDVAVVVEEEGEKLAKDGVDIIIVLSHAGIEVDQEVAKRDKYVDIIVGGHSHTLLHNGEDSSGEEVFSSYPLMVDGTGGRKVAIVQAGSYSRHIGNLTAYFSESGELITAVGDTIYLDKSIPQDNATLDAMQPWAESLEETARQVVGYTAVVLEQNGGACGAGECNLGNLVADAMVQYEVNKGPEGTWTRAAIAFTNSGGLRAPIDVGNITFNDLVTTLPFENTIDYMEIEGATIKQALEQAVKNPRRRGPRAGPWRASYYGFLQVSGLHVQYDLKDGRFNDVVNVDVLCHECKVPSYEPLDLDKWYPVSINSFLAGGGDGYHMFSNASRNFTRGDRDLDVMLAYFQSHNPITPARDGRFTTTNTTTTSGAGLVTFNILLACSAVFANII